MTHRKLILPAIFAVLFALAYDASFAADFAGQYHALDEEGATELNLREDSPGRYRGTLSFDGFPGEVVAAVRGDELVGELSEGDGESYTFTAERRADGLLLLFDDGEYLRLQNGPLPAGSAQSAPPPQYETAPGWPQDPGEPQPGSGNVSVNGQRLTPDQVAQLTQFGVQVYEGDYWYDPVCGAWGIWGGPTQGFVTPGINLAPLPAHASNGKTGVYVNGRNLTQSEHNYLMALAGGAIYPGEYWLDAQGYAGYVGGPALINYIHAAQQGRGQSQWYGNGASGWTGADGSGGVWISNPSGGTGTTVTY